MQTLYLEEERFLSICMYIETFICMTEIIQ